MINLQIESRFQEFFGVMSLHSYYTDLVTRDLEFEPTPETAQLLKNYQLVFKPLPFGFLVLLHPDYSPQRLSGAPLGTKFTFAIKNRNARFMNFSEIPFWPEGVAFHYSNLEPREVDISYNVPKDAYYYFKHLKVAETKKNLLHLPQHALVPLRPRKFSLNIQDDDADAGISYDDIVLKDERGSETLPSGTLIKKRFRHAFADEFRRYLDHETRHLRNEDLSRQQYDAKVVKIADELEKKLSSQKRTSHVVDIKHTPFGKYTLEAGKKGKFDFCTAEVPSLQFFGLMDIHLDSISNALLNRKAKDLNEVVNPQIYHIHFKARPTYWRYYFLNYKNSKVSPAEIRDENEVVKFTKPLEGMVESVGAKAYIAETLEPIELRDRPEHVFFLSREIGMRSIKDLRLPVPNADKVKPIRTESGEKIYSDIYVYL